MFDGEEVRTLRALYDHINKFLNCFQFGFEIVVVSLTYIDRLLMENPDLTLTHKNAMNISFAALTLAAKFYDDRFEKNTLFCAVANISRKQMKKISTSFLGMIKFDLIVSQSLYSAYENKLN